jgi:hypothetical protein
MIRKENIFNYDALRFGIVGGEILEKTFRDGETTAEFVEIHTTSKGTKISVWIEYHAPRTKGGGGVVVGKITAERKTQYGEVGIRDTGGTVRPILKKPGSLIIIHDDTITSCKEAMSR